MFETRNDKTKPVAGKLDRTALVNRRAPVRHNPVWQSLALSANAIQPKLTFSRPDDPYEQEADRVADRVMRIATLSPGTPNLSFSSTPAVRAQRKCAECEEEEDQQKLQRKEAGGNPASPSIVRSAVDRTLGSSGQPLDPNTRAFFEPRFGRDFSDVRVHADGQADEAAYSVDAKAFTRGREIAFRSGQYSPLTQTGRRLLAHELAHVVQQRSAAAAPVALLARQTFGTAKTTAPPAKNVSPGDVFRGRLKDEVALFANAGVILDWIVALRGAGGGVASFATTSLFADAATMKKIKPKPASAADLAPALEMLQYFEVVKRKDPDNWDVVLAPLQPGQTQPDVNRAKFDQNRTDITAFQKSFETRFDEKGHPIKQIAQQELLEDTLAAGAKSEFKAQTDAEKNLADVTAEFGEFVAFLKKGKPVFRVTTNSPAKDTVKGKTSVLLPIAGKKKPMAVDEADFDHIESILTGTSKEVEARRKDIEKRQKAAQGSLFRAQGFHRFAVEMVWFLRKLDTVSTIKFRAGTYGRHGKFGEYAADMYPVINENKERFYELAKAEQFVDDINKVAEEGHYIWGKFAWQIVYNDTKLQAKINAKYGHRMSSAPHHGPAPDKLHMHLDIRPLDVKADASTGFGINWSGRVVLY